MTHTCKIITGIEPWGAGETGYQFEAEITGSNDGVYVRLENTMTMTADQFRFFANAIFEATDKARAFVAFASTSDPKP